MHKLSKIFLNALPIFLMIALIPFISDDYILTFSYIAIILIAFAVSHARYDVHTFVFGFIIMTISEYLFISTGVETFNRTSLFGVMPLWLPFLWGYGFVAIQRSVALL